MFLSVCQHVHARMSALSCATERASPEAWFPSTGDVFELIASRARVSEQQCGMKIAHCLSSDALEKSWKLGGIPCSFSYWNCSWNLESRSPYCDDEYGAVERTLKGILTIDTLLVFPVVPTGVCIQRVDE